MALHRSKLFPRSFFLTSVCKCKYGSLPTTDDQWMPSVACYFLRQSITNNTYIEDLKQVKCQRIRLPVLLDGHVYRRLVFTERNCWKMVWEYARKLPFCIRLQPEKVKTTQIYTVSYFGGQLLQSCHDSVHTIHKDTACNCSRNTLKKKKK